jgi:heterotetrameric sarcosine oxidase gamma subunit
VADPVTIRELSDFGLATIMARRDVSATAVGEALGIILEDRAGLQVGPGIAMIGTGPGQWFAFAGHADPQWASRLGDQMRDVASVSDQSSGYTILRLSGDQARTILQRGASIDFDPSAFSAGSTVATMISYVSVYIWQIDDEPMFDIAMPKSFSRSFRHWLDNALAAL